VCGCAPAIAGTALEAFTTEAIFVVFGDVLMIVATVPDTGAPSAVELPPPPPQAETSATAARTVNALIERYIGLSPHFVEKKGD